MCVGLVPFHSRFYNFPLVVARKPYLTQTLRLTLRPLRPYTSIIVLFCTYNQICDMHAFTYGIPLNCVYSKCIIFNDRYRQDLI